MRQDDVVEAVVGIVVEIGVGVALDHRQSLRDAIVHAMLRNLDAASIDAFFVRQQLQESAISAADVQHTAAGRDHIGDDREIGAHRRLAQARRCDGVVHEPFLEIARRQSSRMGGGFQKSARRRDEIGFMQQKGVVSLVAFDFDERNRRAARVQRVNDRARVRSSDRASRRSKATTQNRVFAPLKAFARAPP